MYSSIPKIFSVFTLWVFFTPSVHASELLLYSSKVDVSVGEEFTVDVIANSDESVNAISGRILFPDMMLEMREIRDGNSSINFWIEKPNTESAGTSVFSGITPGGFSGVNNLIFSIVFKAKQEGVASISIAEAKALQNDGSGTEIALDLRNTVLQVKAGDSNARRNVIEDSEPPENFTPIISHSNSLYEDNLFVVFSTQDKGSGISHYEVKEYLFKPLSFLTSWRVVESPYVLSDQELRSYIFVRAVDNAHNMQVVEIAPTHPLLWYEYLFYWLILISILFGVFYVFLKKQ